MVSLPDAQKVKDLITQNFGVSSLRAWILMGYSDPTTVRLEAHGVGSLAEFIDRLEDNKIQYFLLRLPLGNDPSTDVQAGAEIKVSKNRDVFCAWTGPGVGIIEKGKKKSHLGSIEALLSPSHAQLQATNRSHLIEKTLIEKSDPKSGSHIID